MKGVRIETYGGPEVAVLADLPDPAPGPGEVRVEVAFAGVNFMDIHTRQGKYRASRTYPVRAPLTLGMEGSGVVTQTGPGVEDIAIGQRVAWCLSWGTYAEGCVVPASRVVPLPDGLSLELAAAAIFHGVTAHYLLHDTAALSAGKTALVLAASGGIGQMLVQLGTAVGARILAVTSSPERAEQAKAQGADLAFTYDDGGFADAAREATGGVGVDVVFDPITNPTLRDSLRAARRRGLIVNFGTVGGQIDGFRPIELGEAGSLFLTRPRLADHVAEPGELRRRATSIFEDILAGRLRVALDDIHPLDAFQEAHRRLAARQTTGKQLLRVTGS
jgi:NADPH2:quinone reductase